MEEVARLALFITMCVIAGVCVSEGICMLLDGKERKDALLMMAFGLLLLSSAVGLPTKAAQTVGNEQAAVAK